MVSHTMGYVWDYAHTSLDIVSGCHMNYCLVSGRIISTSTRSAETYLSECNYKVTMTMIITLGLMMSIGDRGMSILGNSTASRTNSGYYSVILCYQ